MRHVGAVHTSVIVGALPLATPPPWAHCCTASAPRGLLGLRCWARHWW